MKAWKQPMLGCASEDADCQANGGANHRIPDGAMVTQDRNYHGRTVHEILYHLGHGLLVTPTMSLPKAYAQIRAQPFTRPRKKFGNLLAVPCRTPYNWAGVCVSKVPVGKIPMSSEAGSVTGWIGQLQAGDPSAAQQLWERYFQRLVELARKKLQGASRCVADEEDVALSAFASFCRGAIEGRFPQLSDRTDLWRLLVVLTARKALHLRRNAQRQKRGGKPPPSQAAEPEVAEIIGREPTPEFAAQVAEECQRLLALLDTEELRSIARWKMEGHTNEQIAAQLGCAPSTVERRLRSIRRRWEPEGES